MCDDLLSPDRRSAAVLRSMAKIFSAACWRSECQASRLPVVGPVATRRMQVSSTSAQRGSFYPRRWGDPYRITNYQGVVTAQWGSWGRQNTPPERPLSPPEPPRCPLRPWSAPAAQARRPPLGRATPPPHPPPRAAGPARPHPGLPTPRWTRPALQSPPPGCWWVGGGPTRVAPVGVWGGLGGPNPISRRTPTLSRKLTNQSPRADTQSKINAAS
jgi:hypothetical protein